MIEDVQIQPGIPTRSETAAQLFAALAKAQGAFVGAKKDRENNFLGTSYATLSSVIEACRKPLSENGLSIIQTFQERTGNNYLVTTLAHESGEWMSSWLPLTLDSDEKGLSRLQVFGKQITYLRRYSYIALVGVAVAEDEDDGNRDGRPQRSNQREPQPAAGDAPKTNGNGAIEIWEGPDQCPKCHAPGGKKHGKPCCA